MSLLLIPVTPCVLLLTAATGDDWLARLGLLILLEHGLWLVGIRVATEFAITQPTTRGAALWARRATAVDALAAMLLVLSLGPASSFDNVFLDRCLYTALAAVLVSRGVALWLGTGAVAAVLRALGFARTALGLRLMAALACLATAASATGLGLVLYAEANATATLHEAQFAEWGYFLLLVGLPALWFVALVAGGVCLRATIRLNHQFGRVAAALRRTRAPA